METVKAIIKIIMVKLLNSPNPSLSVNFNPKAINKYTQNLGGNIILFNSFLNICIAPYYIFY